MKMKRISLLLVLLVTLSGVAQAQSWNWGLEGGVELSRFKAAKGLMSQENRVGGFLGGKIKAELPLPNLAVDASLLYNQNKMTYIKGGKERNKKLHMFVIPLNLRYDYDLQQNFGIYLATGPQWNWFIGNSDIGGMGGLRHSFFDWNVGGGFNILRHVQIGFNYNIPLGKMGEVNNVDLEGRSWNFRFGYWF